MLLCESSQEDRRSHGNSHSFSSLSFGGLRYKEACCIVRDGDKQEELLGELQVLHTSSHEMTTRTCRKMYRGARAQCLSPCSPVGHKRSNVA